MEKIQKILVANRGEIALRILKTIRKMGIDSVVIYAEEDKNALFVKNADQVVYLEGKTIKETYLNHEKIVEIAKRTGCQAIHPGYGFLSENEQFARHCEDNGIIFIGPDAKTIALLGNKKNARKIAEETGIPVPHVFPANKILENHDHFPCIIKASNGGGGKGMRIVNNNKELKELLEITKIEALSAFNSSDIYIEKYIPDPRHIEVQILADQHGNAIHLFERDCTVQRKFQKIIEESPSSFIADHTRQKLFEYALLLIRKTGYYNAGTVEFLVDNNENIYFLEVNTRVQVEHPVTEMLTGRDIIHEQISIAAGKKLSFSQSDLKLQGHAIEARVCAEHPEKDFTPSPGKINLYKEPAQTKNIRIDSGYSKDDDVPPSYDSLISKVIVHDQNRTEAIQQMINTLKKYHIHGIHTNLNYLINIFNNRVFIQNKQTTHFLKKYQDKLVHIKDDKPPERMYKVVMGAFVLDLCKNNRGKGTSAFHRTGYWRFLREIPISIEGKKFNIEILESDEKNISFTINNNQININTFIANEDYVHFNLDGVAYKVILSITDQGKHYIEINSRVYELLRLDALSFSDVEPLFFSDKSEIRHNGHIKAPLFGKISRLNIANKEKVKKGDTIVVIESMKMENNILAHKDGMIKDIFVKEGDQVNMNDLLIMIE